MGITYKYGGIKEVTEHIIDRDENKYYDKYSKTSSKQVVVNSIQDTRLDSVLRDIESRISNNSGIPSQVGNSGKVLSTNGETMSWKVIDALPSQSGNTGKVLSTDGTSAFWAEPIKLTSTVYPSISDDNVGNYGNSNEAARADHKHPFPIFLLESYITAVGGETELTLTEQQYPSGKVPYGFHLYRNGLLLTPEIDYTFNSALKLITFSKACEPKENIIIVLGYINGNSTSSGEDSSIDTATIITTDEVPLMDGEAEIGNSSKAANAKHRHPHDTTKADIISPHFLGTPTLETSPVVNTNDNSIATTKFVIDQLNYNGYNNSSNIESIIPAQSSATENMVLASDGHSLYFRPDKDSRELPSITVADYGKVLTVGEGDVRWLKLPSDLPDTTNVDIGSVLLLDSNKNPIWGIVHTELPEISEDTANKLLSNDGNDFIWLNPPEKIILSDRNPEMNADRAYPGILNEAARIDHKHPHDTVKANITSPIFTGNPQSPTPILSNNSNSIATTSYVHQLVDREISNAISYNSDYVVQNSDRLFTLQNVNETLQDLGFVSDVRMEKTFTIRISGIVFNGDSSNLVETISDTLIMNGMCLNSDSSNVIPDDNDEENTEFYVPIDFSKGNNVLCVIDKHIEFKFIIDSESNSNFRKVTLTLYNGNQYMITWPENVHWDGIYAPEIETVMTTIEFITFNNGDEWYGKVWGRFN